MLANFLELRYYLIIVTSCTQPNKETVEELLVPLKKTIEVVAKMSETCRKDRDWGTHIAVVAESAPIVGWVVEVCKSLSTFNGG